MAKRSLMAKGLSASSSMMVGALMFLIAGTQMVVMLPSALVPGISVPSFMVIMCSLKTFGK